jgi:Protein of unknown function (DUF3108)
MRFIIISLLFCTNILAQTKRSKDLLPTNMFHAGEFARYKVIYKWSEIWITAGHFSFEFSERAVDSQRHTVCIARGNTAPTFDIFYKVRDEYATILEPNKFLPKFFLRRVNEGGFKIHNDFDFRQDSLKVIAEMQDSKHPHRIDTMKIEPNTQDIVSAILYCRSLNYAKLDSGQQYEFPIFLDNELFHVGIKYLGKQEISTEYGDFKCLVLQPLLLTGRIFSEADKMRIYITDDDRRIPVYIESPLKVGKVVAVLINYKK